MDANATFEHGYAVHSVPPIQYCKNGMIRDLISNNIVKNRIVPEVRLYHHLD